MRNFSDAPLDISRQLPSFEFDLPAQRTNASLLSSFPICRIRTSRPTNERLPPLRFPSRPRLVVCISFSCERLPPSPVPRHSLLQRRRRRWASITDEPPPSSSSPSPAFADAEIPPSFSACVVFSFPCKLPLTDKASPTSFPFPRPGSTPARQSFPCKLPLSSSSGPPLPSPPSLYPSSSVAVEAPPLPSPPSLYPSSCRADEDPPLSTFPSSSASSPLSPSSLSLLPFPALPTLSALFLCALCPPSSASAIGTF